MERWRPVYGVMDILNAVMVLLNDPNPNSPENVDAGVNNPLNSANYFRFNFEKIKRHLRKKLGSWQKNHGIICEKALLSLSMYDI